MLPLRSRLYTVCDPARPIPADDDVLYVDWPAQLLATDDPKSRLANSIALGAGTAQCRFVTGHRGVGKTTELLRVKAILERGDTGRRLFAPFVSAFQWIQADDIEAKAIVFVIVRQLVTDLEGVGIGFARQRWSEFLKDLWQRLTRDIDLDKATVEAGPLSLDLVLKSSAEARREFRSLLERRLPTLYDMVNDTLQQSREELRKRGFDDIVVIVDELDKIPMAILNPDLGLTNHEQIFFHNSNILRSLGCDVVYTVPIELAYSTRRQRFQADYSAEILTVPVLPLADRAGKRNDRGHDAFLDVLRRRVEQAGGTWSDVWSDELVERLCQLSGGHFRQLFLLIRSSLERGGVPITEEALAATVRRQAIDMTLPLTEGSWALLRDVHATKRRPAEERSIFDRMLRDLYVLVYEDEAGTWYDWNPLLGEAPGQ